MKKIFAIILVCALALTLLTACGDKDNNSAGNQGSSSSQNESASQNATTSQSQDTSAQTSAGSSTQSQDAPVAAPAAAPISSFSGMISVVTREEGSGTRDAVRDLFGIKDADGKENVTPEAMVQDSTGNMMTAVAGDPNAIGYCSLASLNDTVKALSIDGVDATSANVKNGSYKIQRPFYLATMGEADGLAQDFIEFILSAEGQTAATKRCIPVDDNAPAYSGSAPAGRIVVGGSSSVSPVMEDLIKAYKEINPNAELELQTSDSSKGMSDAKSGAYDIGMASRELKDSEIEDGLIPVFIAIDGIAVIVNGTNPLTGLSVEQVRNIYNGEFEDWADVQ